MRMAVLAGAGSLVVAGVVLAGVRLTRPSHGQTRVAPTEIAPDLYCLGPWGRTQTNVYLVHSGSAWMLIDAGWERDAGRIQAATSALLGDEQVPAAILLTHVHPDHAGSARALAAAWACPVYVHPAEIPLASGDFAAMERFAGPLDRWLILPLMHAIGRRRRESILASGSLADLVQPLEAAGSVPGLDGWRWAHTPGHTPGHVAYVRTHDRIVVTGDALVTLEVNTWSGLLRGRQGLSGPPWYTTWDGGAATASIAAISGLEPTAVAGGHGWPLTQPGTAAAVGAFAAGARPAR
jgi:glyoxylase-like metal-dependent hydrolase (beta-lactamase superfamily II)